MGMDDRHDGPMNETDPVGDLRHVGDGGGERDERDVPRGLDDDLFPDRSAPLVAHVMALVEDDVGQTREGSRVEHVPEDLRCHDQDRRPRVDLDVTGEESDLGHPELPAEVGVLLVREGLERRRVRQTLLRPQRVVDGELGDQGLAGAGRGGDDHRPTLQDGEDRAVLEVVEGKRIATGERAVVVERARRDPTLGERALDRRGHG